MTCFMKSQSLTPKQERAIIAMTDGDSVSFAATAAKISVSVSTLLRWRRDPAFVLAYRERRREVVEDQIARLQALTGAAVDTLAANLNSGNRPAEVRAAVSILNKALEGLDTLDHDSRIASIEARLNVKANAKN